MAKTQCGGEAELQAAIRRGQVKSHGPPGQELFYFPKVDVGGAKEFKATETMTRGQERSVEEHKAFNDSIQTLMTLSENGSGAMAQMAMAVSGSSTFSGMSASSGGPSPDLAALKKELEEQQERLIKAITLAERAISKNCERTVPTKVQDVLGHLIQLQEESESVRSEARFILKFRKTTKGESLSESVARSWLGKVKACIDKMVDDIKMIGFLCKPTVLPGF